MLPVTPDHKTSVCQELVSLGKSTFKGAAVGFAVTATLGVCCFADAVIYRICNPESSSVTDVANGVRLFGTAVVIVGSPLIGPVCGGMAGAAAHVGNAALQRFRNREALNQVP